MASIQCHKPCEDKSHHAQSHHGSFGQKITGLFKGNHNHSHSHDGTKTHTEYYKQTDVLSQSGHAVTKKSECSQTRTNTHGRNKRVHKKNLLQKVRDGISVHSSDDNCSSESDSGSDSDNDNCRRRKNCN